MALSLRRCYMSSLPRLSGLLTATSRPPLGPASQLLAASRTTQACPLFASFNWMRGFSAESSYETTATLEDPVAIRNMTNEALVDTSTIPGWEFVHTPPREIPRGALVGKVVSDKMNKTINVAVDRYRIVPKYRKRVRYTRKFLAHDDGEVSRMGDLVMIVPCHRISKHKHFMLIEIVRAKGQL